MSIIAVEDLKICVGGRVIIQDATFRIDEPSFVVIIGPNGAGKTTLLKTMIGLIKPVRGCIKILDRVVRAGERYPRSIRKLIGYMPQRDVINYAVPLTAREIVISGIVENLTLPRTVLPRDVDSLVNNIAGRLGIDNILHKFFDELSGGQQQKVLLARALVKDPRILILDEPLSNVDEMSRVEILEFLRDLVRRDGRTVLLVTHDVEVAMSWSDYVLLVNNGRAVLYSSKMIEDVNKFLRQYPEKDRKIVPSRSPYCA
ncbi:MAG: ATP-binding cassette domain-containing protein [Crenarchaeota archaeon]|nr:ATP-binding cassette domain-containing protein [Thermoproteota archaeon]